MLRSTQQREAIREVLVAAAGPLLPEELLNEAQDACPSLGQATVYRALRQMEEAGEIQKVVVGDGRQRYEAAQPHHHHFRCRACHRVFDIDGCVRSPKLLGENLPHGFQLEGHELTLHGLCSDCV